MKSTVEPEILLPGQGRGLRARGARLFDDENLDLLSHVLDDWFRIPGTSIRFGIDGRFIDRLYQQFLTGHRTHKVKGPEVC